MGPNENVTYNIVKGEGRYRNTAGFTKEGAQKPSPMPYPNKNKNKTHKMQMQVPKGESLQCSVLKQEPRSNCSSRFGIFLFKSSRFWGWNPVQGTHSLLLLEKDFHFQFHKQPHPPEPKLVRSILNFRTSCATLSSPHTQTDKSSRSQHSQPQSM